jgi:hypothetical protein
MFAGKGILSFIIIIAIGFLANSCSKSTGPTPNTPQGAYVLKYADSIIYPKDQGSDYIVYPTEQRPGTYSGFPEGIEIDDATGAINVNKSETGLRYRITHVSPSGDTTSTLVVISGITFTDKFYNINAGDSIANPVYNASITRILPVNGSIFDEGNGANSGGCSVKTDNGKINLAETIRNGVFGSTPTNDVRKDFDIFYRLNDGSNKAENKLKVRLYYYETMSDVAPDLMQTLLERQQDGVFIGGKFLGAAGHAKPRPPCVIIIAH